MQVQVLDVTFTDCVLLHKKYNNADKDILPKSIAKSQCTILIHAKSETGDTVMIHVRDFRPYVYLQLRTETTNSNELGPHIKFFKSISDSPQCFDISFDYKNAKQSRGFVPSNDPQSNKPRTFFFVKVSAPSEEQLKTFLRLARRKCHMFDELVIDVCEENVSTITKFLDCTRAVKLGAWVFCDKYHIVDSNDKNSNADYEISMLSSQLIQRHDVVQMAPFRILSFDLECYSPSGAFPEASLSSDPIITIGVVMQEFDRPETRDSIVFCLHNERSRTENRGNENEKFHFYDTECEMINAFGNFVNEYDPDIITGYNIAIFDWDYLIVRAAKVNAYHMFQTSRLMGENAERRRKMSFTINDETGEKKEERYHDLEMRGRVSVDLYRFIAHMNSVRFKTPSNNFKLQTVSKHFLQDSKEDLPHEKIHSNFKNGGHDELMEIARYCVQDCVLPLRLLHELQCWVELVQLSRLCSTRVYDILHKGQTIRAENQLVLYAHDQGYIMTPVPKVIKTNEVEGKYAGAKVFDPTPGLYSCPVATLDFKSLYPSIMMAHNLDYTTALREEDVPKLDPSLINTYTMSDGEIFRFVKTAPGIIPSILKFLLVERNQVKRSMKEAESGSMQWHLLNGRQLAIKVLMNSLYGVAGASEAKSSSFLSMKGISKTTCRIGVCVIEETAEIANRTILPDGVTKMQVVYGDTDSVMVAMRNCDNETAKIEGEKLGDEINSVFQARQLGQIEIELEHIYNPYCIWKKKKYIGFDTLDDGVVMKGIECVRSDTCSFVGETMKSVIEIFLRDEDKFERSLDVVCGRLKLLLHRATIDSLRKRVIKGYGDKSKCTQKSAVGGNTWDSVMQQLHDLKEEGVIQPGEFQEMENTILHSGDVDAIVKELTNCMVSLIAQEQFITSNKLNDKQYKIQNAPHLAVVKKLKDRKQEIPQAGARVPYVFISDPSCKSGNVSDRAEDPMYALENCLVLDYEYYAKTLLTKMKDIFSVFEEHQCARLATITKQKLQDFSPSSAMFGQRTLESVMCSKTVVPDTKEEVKEVKEVSFVNVAKNPKKRKVAKRGPNNSKKHKDIGMSGVKFMHHIME